MALAKQSDLTQVCSATRAERTEMRLRHANQRVRRPSHTQLCAPGHGTARASDSRRNLAASPCHWRTESRVRAESRRRSTCVAAAVLALARLLLARARRHACKLCLSVYSVRALAAYVQRIPPKAWTCQRASALRNPRRVAMRLT